MKKVVAFLMLVACLALVNDVQAMRLKGDGVSDTYKYIRYVQDEPYSNLRSVLKTCIHVLYRNGGLNAIWKILDGTIIKKEWAVHLAYLVLKELL